MPVARCRPLSQVNTHKDLGRLPELNDIDDILQREHREAATRHQLGPCQTTHPERSNTDRSGNPLHQVQRHKEQLVASTHEKEDALKFPTVTRAAAQLEYKAYRVVVVIIQYPADITGDQFVTPGPGHQRTVQSNIRSPWATHRAKVQRAHTCTYAYSGC